ncbi:uncharacterized protein LOC127860400 isoform X2 [Dreissena polymorpha]|uniref:uncharacterized protein LOC127860400 isoform X2 n=1 Tax=Dreissena polymorpha TaxID=45954 RepID=UPI002263DBC1|nr:uncharacterized protein LOC127860400 isoform X2 [Dreissena polymorpha]
MCLFGILGVLIVLNKSTHAENYRVSKDSTEWLHATCNMAAPQLSYKNVFFEVKETRGKLQTSDVWIGYVTAKVPFYFHGCAVVQNETPYTVTSIGYCKSLCVNSTLFGVQTIKIQNIVNPTVPMNCRCVTRSMDAISFGKCDGTRCEEGCYAVFSQITAIGYIKDTGSDGDCLAYYKAAFSWQACTRSDSIKSLCSTNIATGDHRADTWSKGNAVCLDADRFPATLASVNNTNLYDYEDYKIQQYYWTGIIRANTLLRRDSIDSTYHSNVSYGFLDRDTGELNFTSNGFKPALCASEGPIDDTASTESHTTIRGVTKSSESQTTMRGVTQSTEGQVIIDDTKGTTVRSADALAIEIGIGVTVAVLIIVVVVIIVLRRRKRLLQLTNHKSPVMMSANSVSKSNCRVTVEKAVPDNSFHVKEKLCPLEEEHLDHKSTANVSNIAIVDAIIYHTINDVEEPRGNVTGDANDYDYTTTKVVQTATDPDKVYNKLKLERRGDYNHVKGHCQMLDLPTSNHYDTASVSGKENTTLSRVNDDYDHVGGKERIHIASTSNDYDMTDSAMAVRSRSASANVDEGEYNHISNPP